MASPQQQQRQQQREHAMETDGELATCVRTSWLVWKDVHRRRNGIAASFRITVSLVAVAVAAAALAEVAAAARMRRRQRQRRRRL